MIGPEDFYKFGNSAPPRPSAPVTHARPELRPTDLGDKPVLIFDTETAGLGRPGTKGRPGNRPPRRSLALREQASASSHTCW